MPQDELSEDQWFDENLRPHELTLRGWLRSRLPASLDVEDVLQEAYVRVLKARRKGMVRSPKAFLFTTARNLAIDLSRRHSFLKTIPYLEDEDISVLDVDEGAFECLAKSQELELLTDAIQALPKSCRRIFTLRKVYNMPQTEIAEELGLSIHTVSNQLGIGFRKCREYMRVNCDGRMQGS